jgi:hypothetical protein
VSPVTFPQLIERSVRGAAVTGVDRTVDRLLGPAVVLGAAYGTIYLAINYLRRRRLMRIEHKVDALIEEVEQ